MHAMSPYHAPIHETDSSRPSIGFPFGTVLLLIVIFSICGFYSCCYHWEKFRSLRQSLSSDVDIEANSDGAAPEPMSVQMGSMFEENQSLLVIMPGDKIAKFIAKPCPCQPPRLDQTNIQLPMSPKPPI